MRPDPAASMAASRSTPGRLEGTEAPGPTVAKHGASCGPAGGTTDPTSLGCHLQCVADRDRGWSGEQHLCLDARRSRQGHSRYDSFDEHTTGPDVLLIRA